MNRFLFVITALLCFSMVVNGQQLNHRLGEILVSVDDNYSLYREIDKINLKLAPEEQIQIVKKVSDIMDIWLISIDAAEVNEYEILAMIKTSNWATVAQFNHIILNRSTFPNDPRFGDQWYHYNDGIGGGAVFDADIDSDEAWDFATGNMTPDGREIVVAVVDDGIQLDHPDFAGNIWVNSNEIPGNNIDDDGNGYIDDINGWNTFSNNGVVDQGNIRHGVFVSGMIGARGDNNEGIAGLNWNVKIMVVKGGDGSEANALASYEYILKQRRAFNQSNGTEGAFVVSANSSWGIDGDPEDAPLWCAYYDTLGLEGIVSCAATKNQNQNVDIVGDLPTACPSDYLLTVTATDQGDRRTFSAYGKKTIDMAAPGEEVWTTDINSSYKSETGTSFATPLVAGAVALLYSSPCQGLIRIADSDPKVAAQMAKEYLMANVDKLPQFENELVTGGRLNIGNAMRALIDNCEECPSPTSFQTISAGLDSTTLVWSNGDSITVNAYVRSIEEQEWDTLIDVTSPLTIATVGCSAYEIQFESICSDTSSSMSEIIGFTSSGCCSAPAELMIEITSQNEIIVSWPEVAPANSYDLRYRTTQFDWIDILDIQTNQYTFPSFKECDLYEIQVRSTCTDSISGYTEGTVLTPDCYNCDTLSYCEIEGINSTFEWIDSFSFGDALNVSGANGGYGDFTGEPFVFVFPEEEYIFQIVPGYAFNTLDEYFKIWIDYNQNGEFGDADELVYDSQGTFDEAVNGTILIPSDALLGNTRMRVAMKYIGAIDTDEPDSCGMYADGEVEDYCIVVLGEDSPCPTVSNLQLLEAMGSNATVNWNPVDTSIAYTVRWREVGMMEWMEKATLDTFIDIDMLTPCKPYEVAVRTVCPFDTSQYGRSLMFIADCPNPIDEPEVDLTENLKIFPNPFTSQITIEWQQKTFANTRIEIYDLKGARIYSSYIENLDSGFQSHQIRNLHSLNSGVYIVNVLAGNQRFSAKVIKG